METVIQKPKLLELTKQPSIYKLIVSVDLEKKIRYFLDRFPSTEYSGTLFYKVSGSFKDKNLVVEAIDFILQDIGTSGYTEFNQSPDVVSYMVEHPELLDENVYQGLMHSHHKMGAFFSGTDYSTLRSEGSERTHFVSLIIDTAGTYQAAITRVVVEEMKATGFIKYPTFNSTESVGEPIAYNFTRKRLEYFPLEVEIPIIDNPYGELSLRIEEILKQKEEASKSKYTPTYDFNKGYPQSYPQQSIKQEEGLSFKTTVGRANIISPETKVPEQTVLPFEKEEVNDTPPPYGMIKADKDLIYDLVSQLLTGDITYFKSLQTNFEKLAEEAESIYALRFEDDKLFHTFAEQFIEFLVYYTEDAKLAELLDDDVSAAIIAYDMLEVLESLPKKGKVIDTFIEILNRYII